MEETHTNNRLKPLNSYVAILVPYITKKDVDFLDGQIEIRHTSSEEEKSMAASFGYVYSLPLSDRDIHNHGVNSDLDLREGDELYFDRMYTQDMGIITKVGRTVHYELQTEFENGKVILVPSRAIIMVKRDGEYIACNDYIIGTLVDKSQSHLSIKTDTYKDRIRVVSHPKEVTYAAYAGRGHVVCDYKKGDVVVGSRDFVAPISDDFEKHGLYRMKVRNIVAKIEG